MTNQKSCNNISLFLIGTVILIAGITLILIWRQDVAALFRGGLGMVLALAGLFILYNIKK